MVMSYTLMSVGVSLGRLKVTSVDVRSLKFYFSVSQLLCQDEVIHGINSKGRGGGGVDKMVTLLLWCLCDTCI
jgi:hypothetical protein